MKHGQKICPNDISVKFQTGACEVKKLNHLVKLREKLVNSLEVTL